jgi:GntR family transcriptional regulator
VPDQIAEVMGVRPGTEVVIRRRHLFAGDTFLEQPTVVPKALFLCVEDLAGRHYTRARDQWTARMPPQTKPRYWNSPPAQPSCT